MSGKKGMGHYPESIKEDILKKQKDGCPVRALSREYGISRYAIQSWCGLRPEKEITAMSPRRKGSPRKNGVMTEQEKDLEIKRLKMENDLLRSFLQNAGRR